MADHPEPGRLPMSPLHIAPSPLPALPLKPAMEDQNNDSRFDAFGEGQRLSSLVFGPGESQDPSSLPIIHDIFKTASRQPIRHCRNMLLTHTKYECNLLSTALKHSLHIFVMGR